MNLDKRILNLISITILKTFVKKRIVFVVKLVVFTSISTFKKHSLNVHNDYDLNVPKIMEKSSIILHLVKSFSYNKTKKNIHEVTIHKCNHCDILFTQTNDLTYETHNQY